MALTMRDACGKCGAELELDGPAYICSFECTFCVDCTTGPLAYSCPNCGDELVKRPKRKVADISE